VGAHALAADAIRAGKEAVVSDKPVSMGQQLRYAITGQDMYDALEAAVAAFDNQRQWHNARGGDDYPDPAWVEQARAAMAKARGEQETSDE